MTTPDAAARTAREIVDNQELPDTIGPQWAQSLEDAIAAALMEARASAIEEAARVADTVTKDWMDEQQAMEKQGKILRAEHCEGRAAIADAIAAAIRRLAGPEEGRG